MRRGDFIKHENYLDICLKVTNVFNYGHGYEIKTEIWNMAFVESYPIGQTFRLNIAKDEADLKPSSGRNTCISEWMIMDRSDRTSTCFRYATWRKFNETRS